MAERYSRLCDQRETLTRRMYTRLVKSLIRQLTQARHGRLCWLRGPASTLNATFRSAYRREPSSLAAGLR